jgi:alkaline phosphatase D
MRLLFSALAAATVVSGPAAASKGFTYGVAAGEIAPHGALLWTRAPHAGAAMLEVGRDARLRVVERRVAVWVRANRDRTVSVPVTGLRARTVYRYRFRQGAAVSPIGTFETAPMPASDVTVRFAYSGDADATPARDSSKPAFNNFEIYGRMAAERNDFNINLGDTIYSDSEVPHSPVARTVLAKRVHYRHALALPALRGLRASAGLYSHWDDHEFVNDFSPADQGRAIYRAGVEAFTEYAPVRWSAAGGLYRTFRWGKNVELFFLDERSFRSSNASAGHVCDNGGAPDRAPTLPTRLRNAFSLLVRALAKPTPAACLARIDDPGRTMLGARQLARFEAAIKSSTATFKIVVNEVPIQQFYTQPYDRWEGYAAERTKLIQFLRRNVTNIVFLTTDTHATLVNDVRLRTLEPGGPVDSGIVEVVTGPVATNTFAREVDQAGRGNGLGRLVTALFFKPRPPRGVGMRCASPDTYSYTEVTATSRTLTIAPKDVRGRPVIDIGGKPCAPVVVRAK